MSAAAPADRSYSDAERAQILTQELTFLTQPTSYTGRVGPGGVVSLGARGNITRTQHDISMAQRIQRWIVLVVMIWWLWQAVRLLNAFQAASPHGGG